MKYLKTYKIFESVGEFKFANGTYEEFQSIQDLSLPLTDKGFNVELYLMRNDSYEIKGINITISRLEDVDYENIPNFNILDIYQEIKNLCEEIEIYCVGYSVYNLKSNVYPIDITGRDNIIKWLNDVEFDSLHRSTLKNYNINSLYLFFTKDSLKYNKQINKFYR